jgi:hypothetical protein
MKEMSMFEARAVRSQRLDDMEDPTLNELRDSLGGIDNVVHELPPLSTSDWLHLRPFSCVDLMPNRSAFDRDCAANTCCDIE